MKGRDTAKVLTSIALISVLCGCAATMTDIRLWDGTVITHPYRGGEPLPATNEVAVLVHAGFNIATLKDDNRAHGYWDFTLEEKGLAIHTVSIREVGQTPRKVKLEFSKRFPEYHSWKGATKPALIDATSEPWLFTQGESTLVYELTIHTDDGKSYEMLQPVVFWNRTKRDTVYEVMAMNAAAKAKQENPDRPVLIFGE